MNRREAIVGMAAGAIAVPAAAQECALKLEGDRVTCSGATMVGGGAPPHDLKTEYARCQERGHTPTVFPEGPNCE
jgi:hypothetical protein